MPPRLAARPALHGAQAAYDLNKLRGYQATASGLKGIAALVVLRGKAIRPLLAAAQEIQPSRGSQNPTAVDRHYETVRTGMAGILKQFGVAA